MDKYHRCQTNVGESGNKEVCVWSQVNSLIIHYVSLERPFLLLSPSAHEECCGAGDYSNEGPYDAVVVGLAPSLFTYDNLNTAFRILVGEHETQRSTPFISQSQQQIPLIASHKAKYIRSGDGGLSLGPGPFVAALETASGREAMVVGKPTRDFFEMVIGNFAQDELPSPPPPPRDDPGRIAIIGDDIEVDLGGGAVQLGLWRVLGTCTYAMLALLFFFLTPDFFKYESSQNG